MKAKFEFYSTGESVDRDIILNEAAKRGITIEPFPETKGYFLLSYKSHKEILGYLNTSALGFLAGRVSKNKRYTKWLLEKEGLKVPQGSSFKKGSEKNLAEYVEMMNASGKEAVVKPNKGSQGSNVWIGISPQKAYDIAKKYFRECGGRLLVEEFFNGNEYRIFATNEGYVAVAQRIPANVVGTGKNTLEELVEIKNLNRGPGAEGFVWAPIPIDEQTLEFLSRRNLSLDYIPKKGERVFLRQNSNLSTGGDSITFENSEIDPIIKEIAAKSLRAVPGMVYAGIDLLCEDIRNIQDYRIVEINKSPGMTTHHYPNEGKPQNVAGALIDQIFPETKLM